MAKKFEWGSLSSMPTKRAFCVSIVHNDTLYVVGGCDSHGVPLDNFESTALNSKSSPGKNSKWKRLANMPTRRASPALVVLGDRIIAAGGVAADQSPLEVVEMYDIKSKKWTQLASLGDALIGVSAAVYDNKIVTLGGMKTDTNPSDRFLMLDVDDNRWVQLPDMPTARYSTSVFLKDHKLYVIGGRQGKQPINAFEVFDFKENKWTKLPSVPSKRVFPGYAMNSTHIFSIGGMEQGSVPKFTNVMESFDIEKGEWSLKNLMSCKRADFAVGALKGKVAVTCGVELDGKPKRDTEYFDPETNEWHKLIDIPTARCSCSYIVYDDRLFVIGGLSPNGVSNAVEMLSPK